VTLFEIHTTYGTAAILRLVTLIITFLLVRLVRGVLNAAVGRLTAILCGIDRSVSVRIAASTPPPRHPRWAGASA
jgi:hypothetical protein